MDSFNDVWQAVLDYIRSKVNETAYNLWIKIVKFDGYNNATVTLRFPKPMHLEIVTSQYGDLFAEAFENVLGFKVNISYVCDDVFENEENQSKLSEQDKHLEDYRNSQFTFENFIVGPSNRFAYAAAKAVASDPGSRLSSGSSFSNYNPLFIYGNSGLGREFYRR